MHVLIQWLQVKILTELYFLIESCFKYERYGMQSNKIEPAQKDCEETVKSFSQQPIAV